MIKLAVLGSTRGTDMQAIVDAIERKELNAKIEVVVSNKLDAYILERARRHGLEAVFADMRRESGEKKTREEFDAEVLKILEAKQVDLVLLIGYMRILSPTFVRKYKGRILNVHPSLLPDFAGGMDMDVHAEVIKAGVKETGCTIHLVDEGVDTGEIILQKRCAVEPTDTADTLKAKVQKLEGEAFVEVLRNWKF
ncbi:phosphoribosylglycinamide formyltransferase [Patescibacteria group bacterium]|nr:MAG: phosphoribosylglycinamide formyltransferase [Patescibacteria group bacterium]